MRAAFQNLFVVLLLLTCAVSYAQHYRFDRKIGLPLKDGEFNGPADLSLDANGNIYVLDAWNSRVQIFDSAGVFLSKFGEFGFHNNQIADPQSIDIGPDGNVYLTDSYHNYIQVFTPQGIFLRTIGSQGTGDGQFSSVLDIAFASNGNMYVAEENRIQILSPSGAFIAKFGTAGTGNGLFDTIAAIAMDKFDNLYVVDRYNNRVQIFNSSGTFTRKFGSQGNADGQFQYPHDITIGANGDLYILDQVEIQKFSSTGSFIKTIDANNIDYITLDAREHIIGTNWSDNNVLIFNTNSTVIHDFGFHELVDGKFSIPRAITLDKNGHIYVVDADNYRIQVFNNNGTFIDKFGSYGIGDSGFYVLTDIEVDASLNRYVLDNSKAEVKIFDSNWSLIRKFGSWGSGNYRFESPTALALHPNGNIYVLEGQGNQIKVFDNDGTFIRKFGSSGTGNAQFNWAEDIHIDKNGLVYIADSENYRVQVLDENGSFIREITTVMGQTIYPSCLTVDKDGLIYVADGFSQQVLIFTNEGELLSRFGSAGSDDGQFSVINGIIIDDNKTIYTSEYRGGRVQIFVPDNESNPSITFNDLTAAYGDAPFLLNATSTSDGTISYSFIPDPSNTAEISLSGDGNELVTIKKAGKIKVRATVAKTENYLATSKDVTLSITKAVLTATANNASRSYGSENPAFSATYSGFKYNDNESVIDSKPVLSTIATSTTHWGSYPITPTSGTDDSYDFIYVDGTLFVTKALQTISFDLIPDQLTTSPDFTLSASSTANLPITYSVSKGKDLVTLSGSTVILTGHPGNVTIVAYQEGNDYYHDASASQSFEITQDVVSGLDESTNGIYVGPNPASDQVIVRVPSYGESLTVTLADLQGKVISSNLITGQESLSIPVAGLPKGMYIIGLYTKEQVVFRKIIVQ